MSAKEENILLTAEKRKHHTLSIKDKIELLQKLEKGTPVKQLRQTYNIGASTIYDIKKQKEKLIQFYATCGSKKNLSNRKTMKFAKYSDVERCLTTWCKSRIDEGSALTREMIKDQAKLYHQQLGLEDDYSYGEAWYNRFKSRYSFGKQRMTPPEHDILDEESSVSFVKDFDRTINYDELSLNQIYYAYQCKLHWRKIPKKYIRFLESDIISISNASDDFISILCCANAAGTYRCRLLVTSRGLSSVKQSDNLYLPVIYQLNEHGIISAEILQDWFETNFITESRSHCESIGLDSRCKIVLIMDNSLVKIQHHSEKDNVECFYTKSSLGRELEESIVRSNNCPLKRKYFLHFMMELWSYLDSGGKFTSFLESYGTKYMLYCVADIWKTLKTPRLNMECYRLYLKLATNFASNNGIVFEENTESFLVLDDEIIDEIRKFSKELSKQTTRDLANMIDEMDLMDWLDGENEKSILGNFQTLNASSIPKPPENGLAFGKSDKLNSIKRLIHLTEKLITGLGCHSISTEQELSCLYRVRSKLIEERLKYKEF